MPAHAGLTVPHMLSFLSLVDLIPMTIVLVSVVAASTAFLAVSRRGRRPQPLAHQAEALHETARTPAAGQAVVASP